MRERSGGRYWYGFSVYIPRCTMLKHESQYCRAFDWPFTPTLYFRFNHKESCVSGSGSDIGFKLVQYIVLLFSLCFHEAAHAAMANRRGDPTARLLGRMTLNPLAHIDPIGTVIMPLFMLFSPIPFLFGWAKPVPFNPRNLKDIRHDPALIAAAGPLSNLLLAITFTLILKIVVLLWPIAPSSAVFPILTYLIFYFVMVNFLLALFNLIPVPPLDGGHLLHPFLPPGAQRAVEQIGPFGILIAIFVAHRILPVPLDFLAGAVRSFAGF